MKLDEFGNRMKSYEPSVCLDADLPIIIRLDGRGFSKFTKSYDKPFDPRIAHAMIETTTQLVDEFSASIGYTQSDEITIVLPESATQYNRRIQKLCSIASSIASVSFNNALDNSKAAYFDARVFTVPDIGEAANAVLWRVQDARKNGISSICHSLVGTKKMFKCDQSQMKKLISENGVDYNSFSEHSKFGVFVKRVERLHSSFSDIPEQYRPTEPISRSKIEVVDVDFLRLSHVERIHFID